MYANLNVRTREVINRLTSNRSVRLGIKTIEAFTQEEARILSVMAQNLETPRSGEALVEKVLELLEQSQDRGGQSNDPGSEHRKAGDSTLENAKKRMDWRVGRVKAYSFRGLAPAGMEWEHDFEGESHLLYGPNGCGKSSLLGAVSWCLTGRIFRDDRPPSPPEDVRVFPITEGVRGATARPDALSLMDESRQSTSPNEEYWVAVQLLGKGPTGDGEEVWVRRHSTGGISRSLDGSSWAQIESVAEVGIGELDAELRILMPARVSHVRFGKGSDLIHVFSQIVGLDDLEAIAGLAHSFCRTLRRQATDIRNGALAREGEKVPGLVEAIRQTAGGPAKVLPSYAAVAGDTRKLEDVEEFLKATDDAIANKQKRLAADLGVRIPEEGTRKYLASKEKLANLPGQVQDAINELEKPLAQLFPTSLGFDVPSGESLQELERKLTAFEEQARKRVSERLEWANREIEDERATLMLVAARHFLEGSEDCPVCTQDLTRVPHIKRELETLRPLAARPHLSKPIEDLERALLDQLASIVSAKEGEAGGTTLCERILSDWRALKESRFRDFLSSIASRVDGDVDTTAEKARVGGEPKALGLAEGYGDEFRAAFSGLREGLRTARTYIRLCRSMSNYSADVAKALTSILLAPAQEGMPDSLKAVLERGRVTNRDIIGLDDVRRAADDLVSTLKAQKELSAVIDRLRRLANAGEATKRLSVAVRGEVAELVKGLEGQMAEYFSRLYDNEILSFDMLTTGHAANPNIRDEMNVYLRAGNERIPMGPFCNQGRVRALVLSLIFALLEKSQGALGVVVLDDPTLSLDDEHKARFVDRLVGPLLSEGQVILATHYENFYEFALPVFANAERLQMPPRRGEADSVAFEPADLLERVATSLLQPDCSWREVGGNLRRWAERAVATLSGYCPEPFFRFSDIRGTVEAYARIADPRVATGNRSEIVAALRSAEFVRIMHRLHHNEEVTCTDVKDALARLKDCKKAVDTEIRRFKTLYQHHLLGRAVDARPSVEVLSLKDRLEACELNIVGTAAAAHNGVGVSWGEHLTTELAGLQAAIVTLDTISPIAQIGQCLLLDPVDNAPEDGDLVVVETEDGKRYVRRYWTHHDHNVFLEAPNTTDLYAPINLTKGKHSMRRIVGVLFRAVDKVGDVGNEWVPRNFPYPVFERALGVRVRGDSLKPILRDRQIALVHELANVTELDSGQLACIDIADVGTVIKRCYPSPSEWILSAVTNDVEAPMAVKAADIRRIYKIIGALFELSNEREEGA